MRTNRLRAHPYSEVSTTHRTIMALQNYSTAAEAARFFGISLHEFSREWAPLLTPYELHGKVVYQRDALLALAGEKLEQERSSKQS